MIGPDSDLSGKVAIVGVGETDYASDYRAARAKDDGYVPPTTSSLAVLALERALADCGLQRRDIDGLSVSLMYEDADAKVLAKELGIQPTFIGPPGFNPADMVPPAVAALASGRCDTVALVYAAASRALGRRYGGDTYSNMSAPQSYYYYAPWGWTSQAAHWALMFQYYAETYGVDEADLGSVAITLRNHAGLNDKAIMRSPLSLDDYLDARYIVRPLRLLDMCLVNDGGVCLILRRGDMSSDLPHLPVLVAGWGRSRIEKMKMRYMVKECLRPPCEAAGRQAFDMAKMGRSDIDHFEGYDASSMHLISQFEGYGFVEPGAAVDYFKDGRAAIGGELPVNTSGGMLSEAYMHGWNHVAEACRQLRHEAGPRQVRDVKASMFSMATTDSAAPLILTSGS